MGRKMLRLKSERGHFYDPNTGLRLKGGMAVPHPPEMGPLTREWITCGGIEIFDSEPPPPPLPKPIAKEVPLKDRIKAVSEKYTVAELREKLRDAEIRFSWNAKEQNLSEKLVEAGLE